MITMNQFLMIKAKKKGIELKERGRANKQKLMDKLKRYKLKGGVVVWNTPFPLVLDKEKDGGRVGFLHGSNGYVVDTVYLCRDESQHKSCTLTGNEPQGVCCLPPNFSNHFHCSLSLLFLWVYYIQHLLYSVLINSLSSHIASYIYICIIN